MEKGDTLATVWEVSDHLWERIHPVILQLDPLKATGRRRADPRRMLNGIIFRMRSGASGITCPGRWGTAAPSIAPFSPGSSLGCWRASGPPCWKRARNWAGLTGNGRRRRLRHGRGPFWGGAVGCNPTGRGKAGSKRSILVDASGGPLSVVVAGANVHDTKLLALTLDSIVVERPDSFGREMQHLCLYKGIRQSDRASGGNGTRVPGTYPAHRGGEAGRQRGETLSGPPLGGGTHLGLAVQVPGDSGSL